MAMRSRCACHQRRLEPPTAPPSGHRQNNQDNKTTPDRRKLTENLGGFWCKTLSSHCMIQKYIRNVPKMCKRLVKLWWTDTFRYISITYMYLSMFMEPWNSECHKYRSSHLSWFNSHLPWFRALLQIRRENSLDYVTHSLKRLVRLSSEFVCQKTWS